MKSAAPGIGIFDSPSNHSELNRDELNGRQSNRRELNSGDTGTSVLAISSEVTSADVARVLPFSTVDGPGNRMVFFLQGCNFRCPGCHNPETITLCDACQECITHCPAGALSLKSAAADIQAVSNSKASLRLAWDSTSCIGCNTCLDVCPSSSQPKTQRLSVGKALTLIKRQKAFIRGITLSGGEASLQLKFVSTLFKAIKQSPELKHLTCLLDTNGSLGASGWQRLIPWLDGAMVDLKAWDEPAHRRLTGRGNIKVKQSLQLLAEAGKLAEVRLLEVPGKSDYWQHFDALALFLLDLQRRQALKGEPMRLRLNGYNHHGVKGEALRWPKSSQQQIDDLAKALSRAGIANISLPPVNLG
ncbi:YjjW family glycine radical enzyme activase [Shewanella indica]|uniref:YjjW family glycine radical enzyme activase n=1 Tax=Shewanella indica TaxID=768528 RepID=UPI000C33A933|nr:YjjW family glycine radical enzyme activase [Shewanella indica]